MGNTSRDFAAGSAYQMRGIHPAMVFKRRADSVQGWMSNISMGAFTSANLPFRASLSGSGLNRFMTCPQTLGFRVTDANSGGGIRFGVRISYIDAFGERQLRTVRFGPTPAQNITVYQTPFCAAIVEFVDLVELSGNEASDVISGCIQGDPGQSNPGWGFQLPRHIKSTSDFKVRKGWTSQTDDTQLKAPDFGEGIYYPSTGTAETDFFLFCVPELRS